MITHLVEQQIHRPVTRWHLSRRISVDRWAVLMLNTLLNLKPWRDGKRVGTLAFASQHQTHKKNKEVGDVTFLKTCIAGIPWLDS